MKFTLTYDGPLLSSSKAQRPKEKQAIRRMLHPQLEELLKVHPALEIWNDYESALIDAEKNEPDESRKTFLTVNAIENFRFVALFSVRWVLTCHLDILFLRRSKPGGIIHEGGDVDNRLLTLFDALKVPSKLEELGPIELPLPAPLFCLLQDDSQISGFSVRTGQLLHPMNGLNSDVRLVINVTIEVRKVTYGTIGLLSD